MINLPKVMVNFHLVFFLKDNITRNLIMNNRFNQIKKALPLFSLGIILLLGLPSGYAKEANLSMLKQEQSVQQASESVVSVNQASLSQLITLKGVGQTKAHAIMAYRQQFGDFKSIDELVQVSGIGEKIITENKARLSL